MAKCPHRIKDKRTAELVQRAQAQGFTLRRTTSNHLAVYAPSGDWVTGVATTTGDRKSHLPLRAALRRAGYRGV